MIRRDGDKVRVVIVGELASKANSRQAVPRKSKGGKAFVAFIKSDKALCWLDSAALQVPALPDLLDGDLKISVRIWYATRRPDLDPSLLFDFLQGRAFVNDRQLREQHIYHCLDKLNPRVVALIEPISP
ncbi:MAG: hypothetical protein WCK65_14515 [Rhodospirillaceae bacterium]